MSSPFSPAGPCLRGADSIQVLSIGTIRRDGQTQCRVALSNRSVADYARQMAEGVEFPPVAVWFDGQEYWLSDGFHRLAAVESLGKLQITALVRNGSLLDAQWASYGSNAEHGRARSALDLRLATQRALTHPNAADLSNRELARHLGTAEATVRRWRTNLSVPRNTDIGRRIVRRSGVSYEMRTERIGKGKNPARVRARTGTKKTREQLSAELGQMKASANPLYRPLLNIIGNWALGSATAEDCLTALGRLLTHWCPPAA